MTEQTNPVRIKANLNRVTARRHGHLIAETNHALLVFEGDYPPVQYFPRDDVNMDLLVPTDRHTRCPHKGEASYFSLRMDGDTADNAVWTYEEPLPAVLAIRGYVAFYPDQVEVNEQSPTPKIYPSA